MPPHLAFHWGRLFRFQQELRSLVDREHGDEHAFPGVRFGPSAGQDDMGQSVGPCCFVDDIFRPMLVMPRWCPMELDRRQTFGPLRWRIEGQLVFANPVGADQIGFLYRAIEAVRKLALFQITEPVEGPVKIRRVGIEVDHAAP